VKKNILALLPCFLIKILVMNSKYDEYWILVMNLKYDQYIFIRNIECF
jgi:hypothetical protein